MPEHPLGGRQESSPACLRAGTSCGKRISSRCRISLAPINCVFTVVDKPGVLSRISGILGDLDISILSVIQKGHNSGESGLHLHAHRRGPGEEHEKSLQVIDQLPVHVDKTVLIRIEDPSNRGDDGGPGLRPQLQVARGSCRSRAGAKHRRGRGQARGSRSTRHVSRQVPLAVQQLGVQQRPASRAADRVVAQDEELVVEDRVGAQPTHAGGHAVPARRSRRGCGRSSPCAG